MRPIIRAQGIGKRYHLGKLRARRATLGEGLIDMVKFPIKRLTGWDQETMWALQDVSFEAYPGEVVGIIGRNGAGKSTLLRILSRITKPSAGEVDIYGRLGTLLEIGTGFHPDLTGRENIYLNGAIIGMKIREVRAKFDEIVAFAEIERFVDTPVKHYSSGMYLRLAFAVAAHFEPEVLLLDEVIAIGDVPFQKKCLQKMRDITYQGRTVLLVSHNMQAVQNMCGRVFVMRGGHLTVVSDVKQAVDLYLEGPSSPPLARGEFV